MYKILIIEDEPGVRMTLEDRLKAEGYEVSLRVDGLSGEKTAIEEFFDVILLDVMLPGRDGYAVCANIRKAGKTTPVLMLTARNTNLDTVVGLRQGADDYMAKPFDMSVLLARVEALIRRAQLNGISTSTNPSVIDFGAFTFDRDRGELLSGEKAISLNGQEYRLLEYMLLHHSKIVSRDQLLDEVWGYDSETSSRTVDVHIAKIRQKLGESDQPKHILTIRGRGYKFNK